MATLNGVSKSTTIWAVFATVTATAGPTPTFEADASLIVPGDAGMATIFANTPWAYPVTWEEGNDDSSTGDETNDPRAMTSSDTPTDNLAHAGGADGDSFEERAHFQEFVRLELARRWWVISHVPVTCPHARAEGRWPLGR
jgi:hypothetical protein